MLFRELLLLLLLFLFLLLLQLLLLPIVAHLIISVVVFAVEIDIPLNLVYFLLKSNLVSLQKFGGKPIENSSKWAV